MTQSRKIDLEPGWLQRLGSEFEKPYIHALREFLRTEKSAGKVIYPKGSAYFAALNATPYAQVKVVILGQDPYPGPGQAQGLCFSVPPGVAPPPSLQNIYKELQADLGLTQQQFTHGCLTHWAAQGVLLLNSVLTVEHRRPGSHQGQGWEVFTDKIIEVLSAREKPCVFLLWGSYAQKKGAVIDRNKHKVLLAPHPSPLSAHRGFFGCRHFSECNELLRQIDEQPIDWRAID